MRSTTGMRGSVSQLHEPCLLLLRAAVAGPEPGGPGEGRGAEREQRHPGQQRPAGHQAQAAQARREERRPACGDCGAGGQRSPGRAWVVMLSSSLGISWIGSDRPEDAGHLKTEFQPHLSYPTAVPGGRVHHAGGSPLALHYPRLLRLFSPLLARFRPGLAPHLLGTRRPRV